MAIKTYNDQNFVAIANAIRAKNGETTQYKPSEMAAAISALETALEILPQDTVSGAIANFPDGSNNYPVVELIANIDPKQAGSGDPSPSNVRPISGSTEVKVSKQGKNLLLEDCTQYNANSYITQPFILKPGQYTISFQSSETASAIYVRKGSTIALGTTAYLYKYNVNEFSFTADEETYYYFQFYKSAPGWSSPPNNSQLEVGSAASDFVPYSAPEVKTIDLGSTVYGGTLNVTTGELTVKGILEVFNQVYSDRVSSQINSFIKNSGTVDVVGDYTRITFAVNSGTQTQYNKASNTYPSKYQICNIAPHVFSYNAESNHWYRNNVLYLFLPTSICGSTAQSVYDYLVSIANTTPLTFFLPYSSGNEQTYQLEPEEVKTLLGVNNIYADTGDVEVTYRADIDLYIAKKIAEGA